MKTILARGAYGRNATKADWLAGKDFYLVGSHLYFSNRNIADLKREWFTTIIFVDGACNELFRIEL